MRAVARLGRPPNFGMECQGVDMEPVRDRNTEICLSTTLMTFTTFHSFIPYTSNTLFLSVSNWNTSEVMSDVFLAVSNRFSAYFPGGEMLTGGVGCQSL